MIAPIEITEEAVKNAKSKLANYPSPNCSLRLGVRGSGCSGFSYVIEFDANPPLDSDHQWCIDGAYFIIDKKSIPFLTGSKLTWRKSLMMHGFEFENPQEQSRCGCGKSFTVK